MVDASIILADGPAELGELCGISILERLLRTLQRCGIKRAIVLSTTPKLIAEHFAQPSWGRAQIEVTVCNRESGVVTVDQIVAVLVKNAENATKVVRETVAAIPRERSCKCGSALAHAILTDPKKIPAATRKKLTLIIGKYVRASGQ